jgi:3'(2'), 5'-bisphosphate nucleotidase
LKEDDSPLTLADQRAHLSIMEGLKKIDSNIPVLSEEGRETPFSERFNWKQFWLVDPLDGTKEFIKKNGEFTVNIALIEGKYPSMGIIYAPALDVFYFGRAGEGAYKLEQASIVEISNEEELIQNSVRLPVDKSGEITRAVASRSHMSEETEVFIKELEAKHGEVEVVSSGSSLKFCLVAEGKADYYPRYAPTMEWDTGAGQAIVEAAGGKVTRYEDDERFSYNREDLLNGWFLVRNVN